MTKQLRRLLGLGRARGTRFDRYYGSIVRPGAGYPTADEIRQDLNRNAGRAFGHWQR